MAETYIASIQKSKDSILGNIYSKNNYKRSDRILYLQKKYDINQNSFFFNEENFFFSSKANLVYIASTNNLHEYYIDKLFNYKKNILVEKPASLNFEFLKKKINYIKNKNFFFLEALMYLHHPQTKKIIDIIKQNEIGEILRINFNVGFDLRRRYYLKIFNKKIKLFKKKINFTDSRLTNTKLGGGALNDFACYPISYSILIASANFGVDFLPPKILKKKTLFGLTNVDESSFFTLIFNEALIANLSVSINKKQNNVLEIIGSKGKITVPNSITPDKNYSYFIKKNFFSFKEFKEYDVLSVYDYQRKFLENLFQKKNYSSIENIHKITLEHIKISELLKKS